MDANEALEHGVINSIKTARLVSREANWWVV
nr:MAG TPA: hypothetical protein [Caudoviricetes sp.]